MSQFRIKGPKRELKVINLLILMLKVNLSKNILRKPVVCFLTGEYHGLLGGVKNPMTQKAASRIQSATARLYGGVKKGSFSSRAQSTADRRAYWGIY